MKEFQCNEKIFPNRKVQPVLFGRAETNLDRLCKKYHLYSATPLPARSGNQKDDAARQRRAPQDRR
jgi:hypothetical protein